MHAFFRQEKENRLLISFVFVHVVVVVVVLVVFVVAVANLGLLFVFGLICWPVRVVYGEFLVPLGARGTHFRRWCGAAGQPGARVI